MPALNANVRQKLEPYVKPLIHKLAYNQLDCHNKSKIKKKKKKECLCFTVRDLNGLGWVFSFEVF